MQHVEIYTDGACSGNPGRGGWGAILRMGTVEKELSGGETDTTNNRMEMTAVIKALEALTRPCEVSLYTDSKYVVEGATKWLRGWKARGWKTADRKPLKNVDLWELIDVQIKTHTVTFNWVKGHNGHAENERADELARLATPSRIDSI